MLKKINYEKIFNLCFIIAFCFYKTDAQVVGGKIDSNFDLVDITSADQKNSINTTSGNIDLDRIEGTPFLSEDFKAGTIIDTEKDQEIKALLRYNIFKDEVEVKSITDSSEIFVLKRSPKFEYVLNGEYIKLFVNDDIFINKNNGYLFEMGGSIEGDKLKLYKKFTQIFSPAVDAANSYTRGTPARLDTAVKYFVSSNEKKFTEIEPDRWDILDTFPQDQRDKIRDFMKSNNYKLRGDTSEVENEMINIVSYYNSLLNN